MNTWKVKKNVKKQKVKKPWGTRVAALVLLISTLALGFYDFPSVWNQVAAKTGDVLPQVEDEGFRLGLDLQGGTHLIYEADMGNIPEEEREAALEGVRDVIERRVNAFGVSEPVVQTTTTGGTYRVIIELAGVLDVNEAISLIGETPVLEFKAPGEELDRDPTQEELAQLEEVNTAEQAAAQEVLNQALSGVNFDQLVEEYSVDENKADTQGIIENITPDSVLGEYAITIQEQNMYPGQIYPEVFVTEEQATVFKYLNLGESAEMELSHILICYQGATGCSSDLPEIDASIQISNVKDQATPENFADLAQQYSTGPTGPDGGYLGWGKADDYVPAFGLAAAALEVGEISDAVKTEFGYHLIYKQDERSTPAYTIQRVALPWTDITDIVPDADPWVNTELSGKHLEQAAVEFDPTSSQPYVALTFNSEGADLFAQLTEAYIGMPIAIFLDGEAISTPVVQTAIFGGKAVITGDFTLEEAKILAQRLNAGALPVSIDLLSQQTVGPTLGAVSLEKSINAALVGFALVALYMILIYRFTGFIAVIALFMFAFLNLAAYRLFGVTITLAGIAGFVLSLGIAVDANVLIIERFKEEYAAGRGFLSAVEEAVKRAWTAIRDGNLTTLIAAAVLYWFSSSFIRGFALTLSIGVILSMFTAITVTRTYLLAALEWKKLRNEKLFGVTRK